MWPIWLIWPCNKCNWCYQWTKRNNVAAHYFNVQVALSCSAFISILLFLQTGPEYALSWRKVNGGILILNCLANHEIKSSVLVWFKFSLAVWDCQRQTPRRWLLFPEVANFWYFTDTPGTVHPLYILVLSIGFYLPLSTVIHTLMISGDLSEMRAHVG